MEDIFGKFLRQHSYKFEKGYPDLNNKKDQKLLESILKLEYDIDINKTQHIDESELLNEDSSTYDAVIKNKLGGLIPPVGSYSLGKDTTISG